MNFFARFWKGWKAFAHKVGNFQARVILVLFYFVILAPFALIIKRSDPLGIGKNSAHGWQERSPDSTAPLERAVRQW